MGAFWPPDRGGGQGGDGGCAGKRTVGNRTMQKFLGARGLSHTSNNASSLQSAIGLVRYLRDAGDGKEAKQIQLIGEGEREPGARASGQESALGAVAGKDWKLRRMGWNASHGGVVQCRWGVHRLQVLGATRYVPCPGGTWVPRLCSQYPCLALSGFFGWEWAEGGPWDAR